MRPKAFKLTIPVLNFSKHDDVNNFSLTLRSLVRSLIRSLGADVAPLFDLANITVEPVYDGPGRDTEEATGTGGISTDQPGERDAPGRRRGRTSGTG